MCLDLRSNGWNVLISYHSDHAKIPQMNNWQSRRYPVNVLGEFRSNLTARPWKVWIRDYLQIFN